MVLMSGLPGVGKSAIASELGRLLPATVLSVDRIEDAMLRAGLELSFETGVAAYEVGAAVAEEQLALGHSVIADAANYVEVGRDTWRRAAQPHDALIRVIHVECSDLGVHQRRLRQRNRRLSHYPEPTWVEVEQRRLQVEPWSGDDVLVVDSAKTLDATVAECLAFLRD